MIKKDAQAELRLLPTDPAQNLQFALGERRSP